MILNFETDNPAAIVCDPPEGWRYGFPKLMGGDITPEKFSSWLLAEGYPKSMLPLAMRYSRFWARDIPTDR